MKGAAMRLFRIVIGLALLLPFSAVPALADAGVDQVSQEIMCQCGCTMVLNTCECGTAEQMRGEIKTMLGEGKSPAQVVSFYVGKYGDKVLSAPAKQGFNWSAYITPFVGILAAGGGITLVLRQWVFRSRKLIPGLDPAPPDTTSAPAAENVASLEELRAQMERDLENFGE